MRRMFVAPFVAGLAVVAMSASPAFAAAQHGSAAGLTFDIGPSPVGLPSNCPFPNDDANFLFLNANAVGHFTSNANGDWGGDTAEGNAVFYQQFQMSTVSSLTANKLRLRVRPLPYAETPAVFAGE